MLTSSFINSVDFKDLDEGLPTNENTLYADRVQGLRKILCYNQRYNLNDIILLQFTSDSATIPSLKIYIPALNDTISGTLVSSYTGDDTRYFYNFEVTLNNDYHEQIITFTCEQGSDLLTSEPIECTDISDELNKGFLRKIEYNNLDRNNSDLTNYWIDWSVIGNMFFYVECVDVDPNDNKKVEILEGSQSQSIISSNLFPGKNFKTGAIPDYLDLKLKGASSLDIFLINSIQYICKSEDTELFGKTTSYQTSLSLTKKYVVGLNVDDIGITLTEEGTEMAIIPKRNTGVTTAGWQVENPDGYMLHSIFIKHETGSTPVSASVTIGTTIGGDELLDSVQGTISKTDPWKSFSRHYLSDPDAASDIYVNVIGTGAIMDIIINFDTVTES